MAADFVCGSAYIDLVHKEGVEAARGDGSVAWVARGRIADASKHSYLSAKVVDWDPSGLPPWQAPDFNGTGSGETNPYANYTKVWVRRRLGMTLDL